MNEHFFCLNGAFYPAEENPVSPQMRAEKFGNGIFETMRLFQGKILNAPYHFERLLNSMNELGFSNSHFSSSFFIEEIKKLLELNQEKNHARIRLMVTQSATADKKINYLIESWGLPSLFEFNEGLKLDFFPDAQKKISTDAHLKKNNCAIAAQARKYAEINLLDDAIILNELNRISECSIANIFIIKNNKIYTPPLSEACVAGTMRRFLLNDFLPKQYSICEKEITKNELLNGDEIFLTNAIRPIRWVEEIGEHSFSQSVTFSIWKNLIQYFEAHG